MVITPHHTAGRYGDGSVSWPRAAWGGVRQGRETGLGHRTAWIPSLVPAQPGRRRHRPPRVRIGRRKPQLAPGGCPGLAPATMPASTSWSPPLRSWPSAQGRRYYAVGRCSRHFALPPVRGHTSTPTTPPACARVCACLCVGAARARHASISLTDTTAAGWRDPWFPPLGVFAQGWEGVFFPLVGFSPSPTPPPRWSP